MNDHLGVAPSRKAVTAPLQLPSQLPEVVDLAVEDEVNGSVLTRLRLTTPWDVDDREPLMSERTDAPVACRQDRLAPLVWSTVPEQCGHRRAEARILGAEISGDSAHGGELSPRPGTRARRRRGRRSSSAR